MSKKLASKSLTLLVFIGILGACEPGVTSDGTTFQRRYNDARQALEAGDHDAAILGYRSILSHSGPLEPRMRLEYAHALLRASRYDEAAQEAQTLASGSRGDARAAALAVQGTALHESALNDLRSGRRDASVLSKLRSADRALKEMLAAEPDMDPLGDMAERRTEIAQELRQLGAS